MDSWIYMWSFPAPAFLPRILSVFIKLLSERGMRGRRTKVPLFAKSPAVTNSCLAGVKKGTQDCVRLNCVCSEQEFMSQWRDLKSTAILTNHSFQIEFQSLSFHSFLYFPKKKSCWAFSREERSLIILFVSLPPTRIEPSQGTRSSAAGIVPA